MRTAAPPLNFAGNRVFCMTALTESAAKEQKCNNMLILLHFCSFAALKSYI